MSVDNQKKGWASVTIQRPDRLKPNGDLTDKVTPLKTAKSGKGKDKREVGTTKPGVFQRVVSTLTTEVDEAPVKTVTNTSVEPPITKEIPQIIDPVTVAHAVQLLKDEESVALKAACDAALENLVNAKEDTQTTDEELALDFEVDESDTIPEPEVKTEGEFQWKPKRDRAETFNDRLAEKRKKPAVKEKTKYTWKDNVRALILGAEIAFFLVNLWAFLWFYTDITGR